jgi:hypothetical protein
VKAASFGLTAPVCAAIAALSLWSVLDFYTGTEAASGEGADIYKMADQEVRFQQVAAALPSAGVVGYVTDQSENPVWAMLLGAQYVLAPRVLVELDKHPATTWVVGNFARPLDLTKFADERGLTLAQDFGDGVVLFRKGAR